MQVKGARIAAHHTTYCSSLFTSYIDVGVHLPHNKHCCGIQDGAKDACHVNEQATIPVR
jgi:hypothetical protein